MAFHPDEPFDIDRHWGPRIKFDHFAKITTDLVSGPEAEAQNIAAQSGDGGLSILEPGLSLTQKREYADLHAITFGAMPEHTVRLREDGIQVLRNVFAVIEREKRESNWTLRVVSQQANVFHNGKPVTRNIDLVSGDRIRILNNEFIVQFRIAGEPDFPVCFPACEVEPEKHVGDKRKRDGASAS